MRCRAYHVLGVCLEWSGNVTEWNAIGVMISLSDRQECLAQDNIQS